MFVRHRKTISDPRTHDLPDHDLILLYRKTRNAEIIAILFQRYTHLVYGVSLKYLEDNDDAKDAVMEIFESLMTDLLKHDIHNFKSWLHSVTRNHCLMILRRKKPVRLEVENLENKSDADVMESGDEMHQDSIFENYTHEDLKTALNNLKEPQRQCIELFYLEGRSYQEISEISGLSFKAVKSHIQNGKRNLRIKLEELLARKQ